MATTKMATQIYMKILRSGIIRRSIYFGMLGGALLYIIASSLADRWMPEDPKWYLSVAFGVGFVLLLQLASHLVAPVYIKTEERRINDGP